MRRRRAVLAPGDMERAGFQVDLIPAQRRQLRGAQPVAERHHDQQGITLGEPPAGLARGDDQPLDLIRREMLTRSAGLIRLPGRRRFRTLCRKW